MPPTPAGCSITRLLSVMANCPSRKNPSRGVVAIQLGLPRPAFKKAACVRLEVSLARFISSSLISKGLIAWNFFRVGRSAICDAPERGEAVGTQARQRPRLCESESRMIGGRRHLLIYLKTSATDFARHDDASQHG